MLRSTRFSARLALLVALGGISVFAQTLTQEGSDWVEIETGFLSGGGLERLRLEARGTVIVRGGGGNQVAYRTRRRVAARSVEQARAILGGSAAHIRRSGNGAVIEALGQSPRASLEIEVFVPSGLRRAEIFAAAGDLLLRELTLDVTAGTGGGRIDADRIGGRLDARTSGGEIRVGQVGGELRVVSGGGGIQILRPGSNLWAETAGGEIYIGEAGGDVHAVTAAGNIQVTRAAGSVSARTAGGLIKVIEAGGLVRADSGGGIIQVASAGGVRCESMGGPIRLNGVAGELFAATLRGSIFADLIAGRLLSNSILSAEAGDITVLIPSNLAVTVEAVSEPGPSGRIVTEFAEIRVSGHDAGGRTVANGRLNGGGPVLKVAAARGAVYLKRK